MKKKIMAAVIAAAMLVSQTAVFADVTAEVKNNEVQLMTIDYDETYKCEYEIREDGTVEIISWTGDGTEVVIPSEIDGRKVTRIGSQSFFAADSVTSITIPETVESIGQGAFTATAFYNDTNNWKDGLLYIGDWLVEVNSEYSGSITLGAETKHVADGIFTSHYGIESVTIAEDNTEFAVEDGVLFSKDKTKLISVIGYKEGTYKVPETVTEICDYAFHNCSYLESVEIPGSVKRIGERAFMYANFKSIELPEGLEVIGMRAFHLASKLEEINIPSTVKYIGRYAFEDTAYYDKSANWENNLLYIDEWLIRGLSSMNGEAVIKEGTKHTANYAFEDCRNVTSVTIPSGMKTLGSNTFYRCTSLASVTIPETVTKIGEGAFINCSSLKEITIPKGVTVIEPNLFSDCGNLETVTLHDGITSIGKKAFYFCESLTGMTIPSNVTYIGSEAFRECYGLTSVVIPVKTLKVGDRAFAYNHELNNITVCNRATEIGTDAFMTYNWNITIYGVKGSTAEKYASTAEDTRFVALDSVEYGDVAISYASAAYVADESVARAAVEVTSAAAKAADIEVYVAAYNANGDMLGVNSTRVTESGLNGEILIGVSEKPAYVKVFAIDVIDGASPLCEAKTAEIA